MLKFALKYVGVMLVIMFAVSICGWFVGEALQAGMPIDNTRVYPSLEAAQRAASRGHHLVNQIEMVVVTASAFIVFIVMWRRRQAGGDDADAATGQA